MTDDEILDSVRARVLEGRSTDVPRSFPPPEPASEVAVNEAERIIGYPLPPLLRRLYLEVANGGIGPFAGIDGVLGGYASDGLGMLDLYVQCRNAELNPEDPVPPPPGVLFFCDFGCAMWALLDCRHPQGQMWWWEEGDGHKLDLTLAEWLGAWLVGQLDARSMRALVPPVAP